MEYRITMDSFGQECPENWEEISAYLNEKIDALEDEEDREAVDLIWENYWSAYHSGKLPKDAPIPII